MDTLALATIAGLERGPLAALSAALIWAVTSILFTAAGRSVVPASTNLFKTVAATVLFAAVLLFREGVAWDPALDGRHILLLGLSGIAGLALGDSFLFMGYQLLGTRRAMLLQSTHPIVGTILAVLIFGEWPAVVELLGIGVVLVGVALVLTDPHHLRRITDPADRRRGILLCLLAAVGQAVGAMLAKEALQTADAFGATQIRVAGGALGLLLWSGLRGELGGWVRGLLRPAVLWRVSVASVLGPFVAVFLMLFALKNAPAGVVLTLLATAPVWLLPLGAALQKDHPSLRETFGVLVAVAGVAVLLA